MHQLKKILISFFLLLTFLCPALNQVKAEETAGSITVTTSILADMVAEIVGDNYQVNSLIPAGADPHTYTAQAGDLEKIASADVVLYHGLHLEAQLAETLASLGFAVTGSLKEEELILVTETEVDPHYWFEIPLYQQTVDYTVSILSDQFPNDSSIFEKNALDYQERLMELAVYTEAAIEQIPQDKRILVTPHDAFSYFARAYKIQVYAPQGISTTAEASNQTIQQTVNFIIENQVPAIFLDTTSNPQSMEKLQEGVAKAGHEVTVVSGSGEELFSDSTAPAGQYGDNYIDMVKSNVDLLVKYLAP